MSFYFLNEALRNSATGLSNLRESAALPVRVKRDTWTHFDSPRRMSRLYTFDDPGQQSYFVSEIMRTIGTNRHPVKIVIEKDSVLVETRTDTIDDITEIDIEISRNIDEIYDDSLFVLVQQ